MLTAIRNKATSWVVKILFGILIIAFGAWGIGDIFTRQDLGDPVLTVAKSSYTAQEFRRDLERRLDQMQQQGISLTADQFAQIGGVAQLLRQTADRMLVDEFAARIGVTMPLSAAIADIQRNPAFAGLGGAFDRERFVAILRQNGMSEAGYVEAIRAELTRQVLRDLVIAGVAAPKSLSDRIYAYREETRIAETLRIPDVSMTNIPEPDAKALEAYYNDHLDAYQRPEYRSGYVIHLRAVDFTKDVTVSEEEIAAEFTSRQAEFSSPEMRQVQQAVVTDEAKAKEIITKLGSGTTFPVAVKEAAGIDPVDLGNVTKEQLPKEIAEATFAVASGASTEPIKSAFGWHVVHVTAVTPASARTLDDVKEQLRDEIALAKAGDSLVSVVNQLDDALAAGDHLDKVAETLSLSIIRIDAVDPQGKDREGKAVTLAPELLALLQSTPVDSTSQVEALSDGSYAVAQVTGLTPSEPKPLSEVENQVRTDWLNKERRLAAEAKAKELQERLKTAGDLSLLAKEIGQTINVSPPFRRDQDSPSVGIDKALAGTLFALNIGESAVGRTVDGAVLARVTAINPARPDAQALETFSEQVSKALQADIDHQFLAALEQAIPVTRHDDVVQRIVAPQP